MKKKAVLLLSTFTTFGVVAATLLLTNYGDTIPTSGTGEQSVISLSSSAAVKVSPDDPLVHQVNVRNNKFDVVGYDANGGAFGSIQKTTLGSEEYRGMVYNRSAINGFNMLSVKFSGGPLNYVFTDFLMEDMTFTGQPLTSETPVYAPEGKAYFMVFTTDDSKVSIDYVNVTYSCDGSIDAQMIYDKSTSLGGARSDAKSFVREDSFIEIENNPTKNNNNYSTGTYSGRNKSWYRWCGKYFTDSADLGTDFMFGMTIMGTYERMTDPSKFFHYNVWPQFSYGESADEQWVQTYIGNDNYEPHGKEGALRPTDPYVDESYAGRFFTDYAFVSDGYWCIWDNSINENLQDEGGNDLHFASEAEALQYFDELELQDKSNLEIYESGTYQFLDPDTNYIAGGSLTYREAYQAFNMPFWHLKFHVYLNSENDAMCDISINGMLIYSDSIFENYDKVNTPSIHIHTMPMHLINYGVDTQGNPAESYKGWFTYPRLIQSSSYYLKGTFNNWGEESDYKLFQDVADLNHFSLKDVSLTAGDQLKVNDPSLGAEGWYSCQSIYDNCHYTIAGDGNLIVSDTGTYDVHFYLNSEYNNHIVLSLHEPEPPVPQETTYSLSDLPDWLKNANAEIFAWVWGSGIEGSGKWVEVTVDGTSGSFTVESELTGFLLVRCFAGTTTPNWEAQGDVDGRIYNNTGDILCSSGVHSYSASIWYSHN